MKTKQTQRILVSCIWGLFSLIFTDAVFAQPSITNITPPLITEGGDITINGADFKPGGATPTVTLDINSMMGIPLTVSSSTDTSISLTLPCGRSGMGTINVTTSEGTASESLSINQNPTASITHPGTLAICNGNSKTFTANTNAANPTFKWYRNGNNIPGGTQSTFIATLPGIYTVEITNGSTMCSATSPGVDLVVVDPGTPQITQSPSELCVNEPGTFTATGNNLEWDFDDNTSGTGPSVTHAFTDDRSYDVTVVSKISSCSSNPVTVSVTVNPNPAANAGSSQKICMDDPFEVSIGGNPSATGGTGNITYQWSPAAGLDDPTAPNPKVNPSSNTTYKLVVIDEKGCKDSSEVQVEALSLPEIDLDGTMIEQPTSCDPAKQDGKIVVLATGEQDLRYRITKDGQATNWKVANDFKNLEAGSYLIEVKYAGAGLGDGRCVASAIVDLVPPGAPDVMIIGPDITCSGDTVSFLAETPQDSVVFFWDFGDNANPPTDSGPGPHSVVYQGTEGFSTTVTLTAFRNDCPQPVTRGIDVVSKPKLSIENQDLSLKPEFSVFDKSAFNFEIVSDISGIPISWKVIGQSDNIKNFKESGTDNMIQDMIELSEGDAGRLTYEVTAGEGNCAGVDTFSIGIFQSLFVPNLLTPNNDSQNDTWVIEVKDPDNLNEANLKVEVFNRVGAKVFEGRLDGAAWEGAGCPDGTYWYIISDDVSNVKFRGFVTLIRN
ncbi:MAG: gliding motility-associated C-terminal domain-containing protein [Bacteroidetes bacterium]|nr:gliding motility-associated C-terminal domain-containing protein [Bacteroidota bacterium]